MKYISICSGIEAATMAFHGFGWTPLAFSEIEAFPSAVLAHHWPDVPNLGDMTKFAEWPEELLAECDLLVGGPPCQAFSVAGLRKSLDDDRGNITLAYVRLLNHIDAVRKSHGRPPAIALYENVPGLLSTKDNAFGCLIGALCGCDEAPETETGKWPKAGFLCGEARRVGYRVLDAQYFGVAQRRRRIFLVAVPCELVDRLGERACPSEILSLRESVRGNPPTRSKAGEGAAVGTKAGAGVGREPCYIGRASFNQGENAQYDPQITQDGVAGSMHALTTRAACEEDGTGRGNPIIPTNAVGFNWQNGGGYGNANDGLGITAEGTGPLQRCNVPAVAFKPGQSEAQNQAGEVRVNADVMGTVNTNQNASGRNTPMVQSAMQVRRLTPTECCRLQGFPDNHCDIIFREKPAADGPKYRALGNSMAVPCMMWLGLRIHNATQ